MCPKVTQNYKKELRQRILRAAYSEFCRKGYDKTNLDDVAESLGIARGTIYLYFRSKREILNAISTASLARLSRILKGYDWTRGNIASTTRAFYRETKAGLPKGSEKMDIEMMAESTRNPSLKKHRLAESRRMQQIIVDFIESQFGEQISQKEIEIKEIVIGAIALYYGMEMLRLQGYTNQEIEDSWARTLALIISGTTRTNKRKV